MVMPSLFSYRMGPSLAGRENISSTRQRKMIPLHGTQQKTQESE
jgi:hypothetical protein